jgi:hypothetical protein
VRHQAAVALALAACGASTHPPPWGASPPSAHDEIAALIAARARIASVRADATLDYLDGARRLRAPALVMGARGGKLRLNVMSPATGDVVLDLACDGAHFAMIDFQRNCARTGPCDATALQPIVHVPIAPDDVLDLATATPSLVAELGDTQSSVAWDAQTGREHVATWGVPHEDEQMSLADDLELDRDGGHRDIVALVRTNARMPLSRTDFKRFTEVVDPTGARFRVPRSSRFEAGDRDLIVEWTSIAVNPSIPTSMFSLQPPAGLPVCP